MSNRECFYVAREVHSSGTSSLEFYALNMERTAPVEDVQWIKPKGYSSPDEASEIAQILNRGHMHRFGFPTTWKVYKMEEAEVPVAV